MPTYLSRGWRHFDDPWANLPAKPVGRAAVGWFSLLDCRVAVSDGLEDREDVDVGIGEPRDTRAADFGDTVRVGGLWPSLNCAGSTPRSPSSPGHDAQERKLASVGAQRLEDDQ